MKKLLLKDQGLTSIGSPVRLTSGFQMLCIKREIFLQKFLQEVLCQKQKNKKEKKKHKHHIWWFQQFCAKGKGGKFTLHMQFEGFTTFCSKNNVISFYTIYYNCHCCCYCYYKILLHPGVKAKSEVSQGELMSSVIFRLLAVLVKLPQTAFFNFILSHGGVWGEGKEWKCLFFFCARKKCYSKISNRHH